MRLHFIKSAVFMTALAGVVACDDDLPPPASPASVKPPEVAQAAAPPPAEVKAAPPAAAPNEAQVYLDTCRGHVTAARALLVTVVGAKDPSVAAVLEPYNDLLIHLSTPAIESQLMSEVHPDAALREAADTCTKEVSAFATDLSLNRDLYNAIKAVKLDGADADTKRFVEHTLRDFHRAGVDKDDATRAHLKELAEKQVALGLDFDKNIRTDVRKVKLDPADLAGLPDDYIKAHPPGPDGKVEINTDYPDYVPFRTYAKSGAARKALYLEYMNRGFPQNDEVFRQLLAVRMENAHLLGYANWADYITEDKMIKTAKNAQDFVEKVTKLSDKRDREDYATLLKRKQKDFPKATQVDGWETAYYGDLVLKEQLGFDSQSVRPYFDFAQSRDGLLQITGQLFGVQYKNVPDAVKWNPDVDVYDVYQGTEKLGRIYLDLHPRANKFKHAACFPMINGVAGKQLPEGALVTNFPTGLMDHSDVVVMFHEFGHLMHHIISGKQHWVYFSGTATEWDFVEAPSQMLEEWAWDPSTLALFAKRNDTKQPIPAELVKKMRASDEFGKGMMVRQQMFYASLSLKYHEMDPAKIDFVAVVKELQKKYTLVPYVDGTHMYAAFGHLNGYSAMYYTYMWSLMIAKDLLSEFKKHGLLDETTAHRYRDTVLAPGGSRDAADLVKTFLGRPFSFDSYKKWLEET